MYHEESVQATAAETLKPLPRLNTLLSTRNTSPPVRSASEYLDHLKKDPRFVQQSSLGNKQVAFQMALRVQHCKKAMEFFINFSSAVEPCCIIKSSLDECLILIHTETPADQQGKGIAKILVQEGLKYAAENNYKIKPTCPYVAKYVSEKGTPDERNTCSSLSRPIL
ncbi:hypothetical protein COOONC_04128 [Cooperia oncophora]